jgi:sugar lactone lactonase YvrE
MIKQTFDIRPLLDIPMLLGECPLWHPEEAALYWIDIAGQAVHRWDSASGRHRSWPLPSEPGCIARCQGGGLLVAMRVGLAYLDTDDGSLSPVANAPYDIARARFNDGRCDAAGRLWVGTLYEPRDEPLGSLFCVERNVIRDATKPVTVSNGVAFSPDTRTLYHADTTAHRITAYDFDLATGHAGRGRRFKQFSADKSNDYGGRPDGAAVDSEGAYWCAMYEGGRLVRLSPDGELLGEIRLPLRCPTMLAFGGSALKTLYVTTARLRRPLEELRRYPLSGCVLTFEVDVPGCAEPAYVGCPPSRM